MKDVAYLLSKSKEVFLMPVKKIGMFRSSNEATYILIEKLRYLMVYIHVIINLKHDSFASMFHNGK